MQRAEEANMADMHYTVYPIGRVVVDEGGFALSIDEAYRSALTELEGFSHINVLWWAHLLDDPMFREMTIAEQAYRNAPAEIGIFATRSPARPNPIAVTPVAVLSVDRESGVIRVPYVDAEDGTPILDIKPYHPSVDRIREVQTPQWCADWPQWYEDSATFDWGAVFENAQ
jgi:tRNA-Thr(GGU) m(6)t(6)A37 methyltransferase TsaA